MPACCKELLVPTCVSHKLYKPTDLCSLRLCTLQSAEAGLCSLQPGAPTSSELSRQPFMAPVHCAALPAVPQTEAAACTADFHAALGGTSQSHISVYQVSA